MFERFTVEARETVRAAVTVAAEIGAPQVDTGHLLVALAGDGGPAGAALRAVGVTGERLRPELAAGGTPAGFDPAALASLGIDYDEVRRKVDAEFGPGALERALGRRRGRRGHVPFAPEGKRALEEALREAMRRRDRHIGAEHILLGTLADPTFLGPRLLAGLSVDLPTLRTTLTPHPHAS